MARTVIADLWTPAIWIPAAQESFATFPALFNSPAVIKNGEFDNIASGEGTTVNVPFFKDITDQVDGIQTENTAPTIQNIGSGQMIAPMFNRETANGVTALAKQVSGGDVVGGITAQLGIRRLKQRQLTTASILRGLFNFSGAPGAAAPYSAVRKDVSLEAGASPAAGQLFTAANFASALGLLGELQDNVQGGALWVHGDIYASLKAADPTQFDRPSNVPFVLERYKGIPIYVSNVLRRAGGTSGLVYDSYILTQGAIAYGEKAQVGDQIDVASLNYDMEKGANNDVIYDRTRFLIHVNGAKWIGSPAGQSPTNAEVAVSTNWNLVLSSADRAGVVQLRTNG